VNAGKFEIVAVEAAELVGDAHFGSFGVGYCFRGFRRSFWTTVLPTSMILVLFASRKLKREPMGAVLLHALRLEKLDQRQELV
jgi:hypothetical protein